MRLSSGNIPQEDIEYEKTLAEQEKARLELEQKAKADRDKELKRRQDLYKKKLERDRLEMLKIKQGIADENENLSRKPAKVSYEKPEGKKAIENFWYHNKMYIILAFIFLSIAGFLIYNIMTTERADLNVMVLCDSGMYQKRNELETFFEKYTPDINGDGKVHVLVMSIPVDTGSSAGINAANMTKLAGELEAGKTMLIISNQKADEVLVPDDVLQDISKDFPLNPNITTHGFKLENQKVKDALGWADMPSGMYIGIKMPVKTIGSSEESIKKQYDISREVLDKLIKDLS